MRYLAASVLFFLSAGWGRAAELALQTLSPARVWSVAEFRIDGVPATANPFDPEVVRVEAQVTAPSGATVSVPAFWYQAYTRSLRQEAEQLALDGGPHWRLRFTPTEPGEHRVRLSVRAAREMAGETTVAVGAAAPDALRGWVRLSGDRRGFATSEGRPLALAGENLCWPGPGGTFDYDQRFAELAGAGQNFARLWLAPWWAPLEHGPGTLTRYRLDAGWQLDQVFAAAARHGIYLLLCFDHHGMYQPFDPTWGGSNAFWRTNPYSVEQGGPCARPRDFFELAAAKTAYQKRLRYLIARYSAHPHLVAWQFFNEIDNVFDRAPVDEATVVAWHREMGAWLRANDPYPHLVSTSLTGGVDRPAFWSLGELDFASYHAYWEPAPARRLAALAADFHQRYGKPLLIGEFGVSGAQWDAPADPHLRGFRQHLWGGALGGSASVALPWWWDELHAEGALSQMAVATRFLREAGWFEGGGEPVRFAHDTPPPADLGAPDEARAAFNAVLALNPFRRLQLANTFALADTFAAGRASEQLSAVLWGGRDPAFQRPLQLTAWTGEQGKLVVRVKEVTGDAVLVVRIDGVETSRHPLTATAGGREFTAPLPAGKHRIELSNAGADRLVLDTLRIQGARPAPFADGWRYRPEPIGLRQGSRAAVYVVAPAAVYPAGAVPYGLPSVQGETVTLLAWPAGRYVARWFDPETGAPRGETRAQTTGDRLEVPLPAFSVDLAATITAEEERKGEK